MTTKRLKKWTWPHFVIWEPLGFQYQHFHFYTVPHPKPISTHSRFRHTHFILFQTSPSVSLSPPREGTHNLNQFWTLPLLKKYIWMMKKKMVSFLLMILKMVTITHTHTHSVSLLIYIYIYGLWSALILSNWVGLIMVLWYLLDLHSFFLTHFDVLNFVLAFPIFLVAGFKSSFILVVEIVFCYKFGPCLLLSCLNYSALNVVFSAGLSYSNFEVLSIFHCILVG